MHCRIEKIGDLGIHETPTRKCMKLANRNTLREARGRRGRAETSPCHPMHEPKHTETQSGGTAKAVPPLLRPMNPGESIGPHASPVYRAPAAFATPARLTPETSALATAPPPATLEAQAHFSV